MLHVMFTLRVGVYMSRTRTFPPLIALWPRRVARNGEHSNRLPCPADAVADYSPCGHTHLQPALQGRNPNLAPGRLERSWSPCEATCPYAATHLRSQMPFCAATFLQLTCTQESRSQSRLGQGLGIGFGRCPSCRPTTTAQLEPTTWSS